MSNLGNKSFDASWDKKLIFDIETIGIDFESLDNLSKQYLLRYAEKEDK